MRKQKLNKRGNIYLRNFLEFSPSSVLNKDSESLSKDAIPAPPPAWGESIASAL